MISNALSTALVRGNSSISTTIVVTGLSKFKRTHGCSCALPEVTIINTIIRPKIAEGPEKGLKKIHEPARASAADPNPAVLRGYLTMYLHTLKPRNHKSADIQALATLDS